LIVLFYVLYVTVFHVTILTKDKEGNDD